MGRRCKGGRWKGRKVKMKTERKEKKINTWKRWKGWHDRKK